MCKACPNRPRMQICVKDDLVFYCCRDHDCRRSLLFQCRPIGASIATLLYRPGRLLLCSHFCLHCGLIGSTNQPVSGITICTFLLAALFLFADGLPELKPFGPSCSSRRGMPGRLSFRHSSAKLQDCLDRRRRAPCASGRAYHRSNRYLSSGSSADVFLDKAFGIGSAVLLAPQASMFSAMQTVCLSEGASLPWNRIALGAALSVVLILIGEYLRSADRALVSVPWPSPWELPSFTTTLPILLGGIVHLLVTNKYQSDKSWKWPSRQERYLCRLVAGEALTAFFSLSHRDGYPAAIGAHRIGRGSRYSLCISALRIAMGDLPVDCQTVERARTP